MNGDRITAYRYERCERIIMDEKLSKKCWQSLGGEQQ